MTTDDYKGLVSNVRAAQEIMNLLRREAIIRMDGDPMPKRSRWERVRDRVDDYKDRIVTAWRVLRGENIHDDGY